MRFRIAFALAALSALAGAVALTVERSSAKATVDPRTYDLRKKVFGKRVGDWTAEWWQWYWSIPAAVNPALDLTGDFTEVGQRGPVWFFSTPGTPTAVVKTATIPAGKALLMPIMNVEWDALDPATTTVEQMRAAAAAFMAAVNVESLEFTLDGTPVTGLDRMRVVSPPFDYAVPTDNVYVAQGNPVGRGIFRPAVSDGYWVFLKPLPIGPHTIHFAASAGAPYNFALDVTWNLTVVDHDRP